MAKGSRQRKSQVPMAQVDATWDMIFGKKDKQVQFRVNEEIGKCGCGRSPTGKYIGWHGLTESAYQTALKKYQTNQEDTDGNIV